MIPDRLLAVAVAVALVVGTGMAATTLESSVESTPDDVVDLDASALPLGSGELAEYERQFRSGGTKSAETGEDRSEQAGDSGEGPPQSQPASGDAGAQKPGDGDGTAPDLRQGPGNEQLPGDEAQSLLERLLELLRALLAALVALLPALAALAVLVLLVAHRDRLADLVGGRGTAQDGEGGPVTHPAPGNDVARAWHELATLAGVEEVRTTTPRQCAAAAVEAGADPTAVERLTKTFEEVQYGDRAVTDERRERAREGLERARDGMGVGR